MVTVFGNDIVLKPDVCVDFSRVTFRDLTPNAVEATGAVATMRTTTLLRVIAKPAGQYHFLFYSQTDVNIRSKSMGRGQLWRTRVCGKSQLGCQTCNKMDGREEARHNEQMHGINQSSALNTRSIYLFFQIYLVGYNSLYLTPPNPLQYPHLTNPYPPEARLRFDGLFDSPADAQALLMDIGGLGLAGPAGGGGYQNGIKPDLSISKVLIPRASVRWSVRAFGSDTAKSVAIRAQAKNASRAASVTTTLNGFVVEYKYEYLPLDQVCSLLLLNRKPAKWEPLVPPPPVPHGTTLLYNVAHSRSGDKGILYCPG